VTDVLADVRAHLREHFSRVGVNAEPETASVTFLGVDPIDVLRFGPDHDGVIHFVSVGGSRHDEGTPTEVVVSLRGTSTVSGLARAVAVLAAAPAVEGLTLAADVLVDLGQPLWTGAPFTAFLLGDSVIGEAVGPPSPVRFLSATSITPTEAAWIRLKGVDAMREAWRQDGVDVLDPSRRASSPAG
jgi:suppressor of fused protein SUFU